MFREIAAKQKQDALSQEAAAAAAVAATAELRRDVFLHRRRVRGHGGRAQRQGRGADCVGRPVRAMPAERVRETPGGKEGALVPHAPHGHHRGCSQRTRRAPRGGFAARPRGPAAPRGARGTEHRQGCRVAQTGGREGFHVAHGSRRAVAGVEPAVQIVERLLPGSPGQNPAGQRRGRATQRGAGRAQVHPALQLLPLPAVGAGRRRSRSRRREAKAAGVAPRAQLREEESILGRGMYGK